MARYHHVRIEAPEGLDRLAVAKAIVGPNVLLKAEPRYHERTFKDHRALEELSTMVLGAYRAMLDLMLAGMWSVLGAGLNKADDGTYGFTADIDWPEMGLDDEDTVDILRGLKSRAMMLLTPTQWERMKQIIRDHHDAFAAATLGNDAIPTRALKRLVETKVLPEDIASAFGYKGPSFTDAAFQYGRQLAVNRHAAQMMSASDVAKVPSPPPSRAEKEAMSWARHHVAEHIRGAADKIIAETGEVIRNADAALRRRYIGVVREKVEENLDKRETWRKLASEIGHATEDWSRDMGRLAATEKQWAMNEGLAHEYKKRKVKHVAKQPNPDCCDDCAALYLSAGRGSKPRIYELNELQANGTNVGKKRAQWLPVIGPTHPWCACTLIEVPDGWNFDEEGNLAPESILALSGDMLTDGLEPLSKAEIRPHMTHKEAVPTDTVVIRIADPRMRTVVEKVVETAPPEIFNKEVGVTLITTDHPRVQNPLDDCDFAYWTGNEIRLSQTLPIGRVPRVIRHELGHSLNVYLMNKLGSVDEVRQWHDELFALSQEEGFVSDYAEREPIENAAEATRMYLFERPALLLGFPQQFAFLHRAYRGVFRRRK